LVPCRKRAVYHGRKIPMTMVVLPTPGPPSHHQGFGHDREPNRGYLALGKNKPDPILDPCQLTVGKLNQALSDDALGSMQSCEKHTACFADTIGNDVALRCFEIERL
jgi:hypothetical protein